MTDSISIMLAGIQGEGFVTTGNILIKALSISGYYTYGIRTFSSRIKGGPSSYSIDISSKKVLCSSDEATILVAFDKSSIELYQNNLQKDGLILYDDSILDNEVLNSTTSFQVYPLPLTTMAKARGSAIMKNTVTVGIISKLLGIPLDVVQGALESIFSKKEKDILQANLYILEDAYNYKLEIQSKYTLNPAISSNPLPSLIGNDAIALGSLAGGCRFMAAYPITPASEVMEYLTKKFPQYNGIVVQTEDEISAVTMALGASYAGCRSMTATSGPGLSLMMEGIGLAGMAEIPIVIVDSQRGGPSTGLPTKTEQSDLLSICHGPHGEIPSIVITPYSVETCFYFTLDAFNLADLYQCPVFILTDLTLSLSQQTIDHLDKDKIIINRGKIATQAELDKSLDPHFSRFSITENGISPRSLPGQHQGLHHITGIEHNQYGKPSESPSNRVMMMDKRLRKIKDLLGRDGIDLFGELDSSLLILGIGSTYGVIKKVVEENDLKVAYGMFNRINPLPITQLESLLQQYSMVLIIENNATGQLASLIKRELSSHSKIRSLLKYDGTPFTNKEVLEGVKELIQWI